MWNLDTAKALVGVAPADTTKDVALQRALDVVLASVEDHLGRGLLLQRDTAVFYDTDGRKLLLPRWPIRQVYSVNGSLNVQYTVHHRVGWLELRNFRTVHDGTIRVDYEGGFDPLPADLEHALWEAFNTFWAGVDPLTGLPVLGGSGTTVVQGSGEIEKVVMPDGGSITWDVGATVAGGDSGGDANEALRGIWGWLAPWASVLSIYRSEAAPSIAFA